MEKRRGELLMLTCAVMWSIGGILIKYIEWSPFAIAGFRSLISGVVVIIFMYFSKLRLTLNRDTVTAGFALGGCVTCFVIANKMTTAANAIVLQYISPAFVLILSALFLKQKLKKSDVGVVLFTFLGIVLFFVDELTLGSMIGNLLAVFSGFCMAIMFIFNSKMDMASKMTGILLAHLLTAMVGIPVGIIAQPISPLPRDILFILLLGVVQLGIPYILYAKAAAVVKPLTCSLIGMAEPLLNPVWVALFYGEIPGVFALAGAVVVILSVVVYNVLEERQGASEAGGEGQSSEFSEKCL